MLLLAAPLKALHCSIMLSTYIIFRHTINSIKFHRLSWLNLFVIKFNWITLNTFNKTHAFIAMINCLLWVEFFIFYVLKNLIAMMIDLCILITWSGNVICYTSTLELYQYVEFIIFIAQHSTQKSMEVLWIIHVAS